MRAVCASYCKYRYSNYDFIWLLPFFQAHPVEVGCIAKFVVFKAYRKPDGWWWTGEGRHASMHASRNALVDCTVSISFSNCCITSNSFSWASCAARSELQ